MGYVPFRPVFDVLCPIYCEMTIGLIITFALNFVIIFFNNVNQLYYDSFSMDNDVSRNDELHNFFES